MLLFTGTYLLLLPCQC